MDPETEAATATKAQRAKIPKSDYAWPEEQKFPITTQAQLTSAARLIGRANTDEATKTKIKSAVKRIAKRKGFDLPKSWRSASKPAKKKGSEATATMSDDMVRDALRAALSGDPDPDGDGDEDRANDPYSYDMCWCYVQDVYDDYFVYEFHDKDDGEDSGTYKRSYTINANDEAVLGGDIQRVVKRVTYDPYVEEPGEGMESRRESWTEASAVMIVDRYEKAEGDRFGKIQGTAIKPGFNKSKKRYYPKETLAESVDGLIGKKMYIDHPSAWDDKNRPERSIRDIGAVIESAYVQTDGGIGYTAIIADPWLDDKMALMSERGILDAFGTSVNYQGEATPAKIEGLTTDRIDLMDYNSLDFVTEAGAWGDVAHLESHARLCATGGESAEEQLDMATLEELQKQIESLTTAVGTLTEKAGNAEQRANKAEARAEVTKCLTESGLPKRWQERIAKDFDGRESAEGIADRIVSDIALYEEAVGHKVGEEPKESESDKLRRMRGTAPKRVVVGNGGTGRESGTETHHEPPKAGSLTKAGGWLFGSTGNAKQFEESFIRN